MTMLLSVEALNGRCGCVCPSAQGDVAALRRTRSGESCAPFVRPTLGFRGSTLPTTCADGIGLPPYEEVHQTKKPVAGSRTIVKLSLSWSTVVEFVPARRAVR